MADQQNKPTLWISMRIPQAVAAKLAVPGGEAAADLHVTLAFCGTQDELPEGAADLAQQVTAAVAQEFDPLQAKISGFGVFFAGPGSDNQAVLYASVDAPGLSTLRETLVSVLDEQGIPVSMVHGFDPHITLQYMDSPPEQPPKLEPLEFSLDAVECDSFGSVQSYALGASPASPATDPNVSPADAPAPATKSWAEVWPSVLPTDGHSHSFGVYGRWQGLSKLESKLVVAKLMGQRPPDEIQLRFSGPKGSWLAGLSKIRTAAQIRNIGSCPVALKDCGSTPIRCFNKRTLESTQGFTRFELLDGGDYRLLDAADDYVELALGGRVVCGRFSFSRRGNTWVMRRQLVEKAATKRENGFDFPAEAYAYVPDPEKPSSWKLRIWETPDKKETPKQIGMCLAALSPGGFRGNPVQIPKSDLPAVLSVLRRAWAKANPDAGPGDLPEVLRGSARKMLMRRSPSDPSRGFTVADLSLQKRLEVKVRLVKSDAAKRYTLGVAYPANELDAHKDFTTEADLEDAAWQYLLDSRRVGLMHKKGTDGAGVVVESYIYRGPEWTVKDAAGGEQKISSGDWLLGVVWDAKVWKSEIVTGRMTGYSMQGMARRRPAPLPAGQS